MISKRSELESCPFVKKSPSSETRSWKTTTITVICGFKFPSSSQSFTFFQSLSVEDSLSVEELSVNDHLVFERPVLQAHPASIRKTGSQNRSIIGTVGRNSESRGRRSGRNRSPLNSYGPIIQFTTLPKSA
ncbi:hypothetical protein SUGI_1225460 [Cryptomeria japonica]|uniref:Uncharacterized protein n=1 Tax=Cryptomeria japonica TaxID=3369 RepID=A0AAD3NRG2_CRYJA|nr:hypothetical protein SUGI_1225460 [Cryptomeria japonica]